MDKNLQSSLESSKCHIYTEDFLNNKTAMILCTKKNINKLNCLS